MYVFKQIQGILEYTPVRDFLSLDNPRSTFEIFDNETIDENNESGGDSSSDDQFPMDLAGTEKDSAKISDFNLLKVIGKGSFGKVWISGHWKSNNHDLLSIVGLSCESL